MSNPNIRRSVKPKIYRSRFGREWEDYEFYLHVPGERGRGDFHVEQKLSELACLFSIDSEVQNILSFFNDCSFRLPIQDWAHISYSGRDYYSSSSSVGLSNQGKRKLINVNFLDKVTPEYWNPRAARTAQRLVMESNNGKIAPAEKFLAGKIGIESFWETVKFFAENPQAGAHVGWAAYAPRNEITVRKLEEY